MKIYNFVFKNIFIMLFFGLQCATCQCQLLYCREYLYRHNKKNAILEKSSLKYFKLVQLYPKYFFIALFQVFKCVFASIEKSANNFCYVPIKKKIRIKWLKLARENAVHSESEMYFCKDHFNISTQIFHKGENVSKSIRKLINLVN